jgi:SET domain-containing protein
MSESAIEGPLEVRDDRERQGKGVFATRAVAAGERLGFFSGTETLARSRMSLQFGDVIVEPAPEEPLRHLNHACEPSGVFRGRELFAARDLRAGDAVTIDYNAHEEEMAEPFACACGSPRCPGIIRGGRAARAS